MILLSIFTLITVDNIAVKVIAVIIFALGVGIVRAEILGPPKDDRETELEFLGL